MDQNAKIYIAGHKGMVGSAIKRNLENRGYRNIITCTSSELDLKDQEATRQFFQKEQPEYVFLAAAKVGGIVANNTYRAQFIYENLMIQNNIIHQSHVHGVKKLLFLGSSCIYPRMCPQPIKEEYLLTGELEATNEPYAIAKIAGIKMCEAYYSQYKSNFVSVMPTNLYGPNDNYNLETSHVLPALIRKMHLGKALHAGDFEVIKADLNCRPIEGIDGESGKERILAILAKYGITTNGVTLWGTGAALREFLHVDDMAAACVFVMLGYDASPTSSHLNVGCGEDISIKDLAEMTKKITGYPGQLIWDTSKPDGTPKKQLDVNKLSALGWDAQIKLETGIQDVYKNTFLM